MFVWEDTPINILLITFGVTCGPLVWGPGRLSGSGILVSNARTPRTLSSEIHRDSRGSSPYILNLNNNKKPIRYKCVSACIMCDAHNSSITCRPDRETPAYLGIRESVTTMALLKTTFRSTGSRMWKADCLSGRALFQSPPDNTRSTCKSLSSLHHVNHCARLRTCFGVEEL